MIMKLFTITILLVFLSIFSMSPVWAEPKWEYVKTNTGDAYYIDVNNITERNMDDFFFLSFPVKHIPQPQTSTNVGVFIYEFRLPPLEKDKELNITAPPKSGGYRLLKSYVLTKKNKIMPYTVRSFPLGNKWFVNNEREDRLIAYWYEKKITKELEEYQTAK